MAPFALDFVPHSRSSGMLRVPSSAQEVIGELGMNMDEATKSGNCREMITSGSDNFLAKWGNIMKSDNFW